MKNNKREYAYFYTDKTELKKMPGSDFMAEFYEVIKVRVFNNNVDEADRKARTINAKLGRGKMPGGYSRGDGNKLPFSMADRYTVINCPDNTKIQPYNDHDKFIMDLIDRESGAGEYANQYTLEPDRFGYKMLLRNGIEILSPTNATMARLWVKENDKDGIINF